MPNDDMGTFSGLIEVTFYCGTKTYQAFLTEKQYQLFLQLDGSNPLNGWHKSLFEGKNAMSLGEWLDWFANGSSLHGAEKIRVSPEHVRDSIAKAWIEYSTEYYADPDSMCPLYWRMIFWYTFERFPEPPEGKEDSDPEGHTDPLWDILLGAGKGISLEAEYRKDLYALRAAQHIFRVAKQLHMEET